MGTILAGENHGVLRYLTIAVVLLAAWTHWRAAFSAEVRASLDDLSDNEAHLEDLIPDLRDNRLAHRCRAVVADHRAGNDELAREHLADALDRIDHLERFAPLRRVLARPPN
jgi:hypothetical protein